MRMRWASPRPSKPTAMLLRGAVKRWLIFRGQRFGAASKPRKLSEAERRAVEDEMRRAGRLG